MVNGEPKLTCKTAPDYGDRAEIAPSLTFPWCAISSSISTASWTVQSREVLDQPALGRRRRKRAPIARRRRARGVQTFQHVHQLHALLLGLPGRLAGTGLSPAAAALGHRYNMIRATRVRKSATRCSAATDDFPLSCERVQRGLSKARRPGERDQPGEAACRPRWAKGLSSRGRRSSHGATRKSACDVPRSPAERVRQRR